MGCGGSVAAGQSSGAAYAADIPVDSGLDGYKAHQEQLRGLLHLLGNREASEVMVRELESSATRLAEHASSLADQINSLKKENAELKEGRAAAAEELTRVQGESLGLKQELSVLKETLKRQAPPETKHTSRRASRKDSNGPLDDLQV